MKCERCEKERTCFHYCHEHHQEICMNGCGEEEARSLGKQLRKTADEIAAAVKAGREQVAQNKANDQKAHEQFIARQNAQKKEATK